ncbi:MAG: Rrf2 family transcriptional regulator [Elusimicrobiales bacterium]|nr:Rrf2 family transcriptional regulator [Elusimicrobiales bacterium]
MKITINISNAAILALHALDLMAKNKDKVLSTSEIAKKLNASYNHLTKIMQQLTRAGIVSPIRGPKGGFSLTKKAWKSKLKNIIEIMDGRISFSDCLMNSQICARKKCVFKEFMSDTNKRLAKVININLSEFSKTN